MKTFEIRGIYSTALAELFLENGLVLVNPSEIQKERFKEFEENILPTWFVRDLPHHEGVIIKGYEPLPINLREIFWDSFFIETIAEIYFYKAGEMIELNGAKIVTKKPVILKKIDDFYVFEDFVKGRYVTMKIKDKKIEFIPTKEGEKFPELAEKEKEFFLERLNNGPLLFKDYELTIVFGKASRAELDKYRAKVLYTITGHHTYKPLGMEEIVDFCEINQLSGELVRNYIFHTTEELSIIHRKANINETFVTRGYKIVRKSFEGSIYLEAVKELKPTGNYDSTEIPIEEGDYAVKKFLEGNWYYITEYYDREGNLKLKYVNINTPIEIAKNKVAYNDLEVDIIYANGKREIVDLEKFEKLFDKKIITESVYNLVVDLLEKL